MEYEETSVDVKITRFSPPPSPPVVVVERLTISYLCMAREHIFGRPLRYLNELDFQRQSGGGHRAAIIVSCDRHLDGIAASEDCLAQPKSQGHAVKNTVECGHPGVGGGTRQYGKKKKEQRRQEKR